MAALPIREPSLEALRQILNNGACYFRYGSNKKKMLVDVLTARAVLACYDAVSEEHKAKFARMIAGTQSQFVRLVDFCWKYVK